MKRKRSSQRGRQSDAPKTRPQIEMIGGDLLKIVEAAEAALLKSGAQIYQRAGTLVRPVRLDEAATRRDATEDGVRRRPGALVLLPVGEYWLVKAMARAAEWLVFDRRSNNWRLADPRLVYARTLLGSAGEWGFSPLRAVVAAPTIDRDGRLIQAPGYDEASGLLLNFEAGAFPEVPERPTMEDARAALGRLARPFREYRFGSDRDAARASLSVVLSALLTAVARPMMRTAPLHAFDAPIWGSGKTKLAECVGILATGVEPAAMSQGKSEEEDEKRLASVFAAGDAVILWDNCDRPLRGDFLCSSLTSELVQARILGKSENRRTQVTALQLATGNNLVFEGDVARRAVRCRVDAETEEPDQRAFDFDPKDEVRAARPALVADALLVLRAYHVAGRPEKLKPFGSFPDYDLIRGGLVWLGQADPADTREALMDENPEKEALAAVMRAWHAAYGTDAVPLGKIDRDCGPLRECIVQTVGCPGGAWNARQIGRWLSKRVDRVVNGRRFKKCDGDTSTWRLAKMPGDASGSSLLR